MALLAALLLLAQAPKPLADLPFAHIDGHIGLKGRLNGKPAHVLLDTALVLPGPTDTSASCGQA